MKRLLLLSCLPALAFMVSCGSAGGYDSYRGELLGAGERPNWENIEPWGMTYIPAGAFTSGQNEQDINNSNWQRNKTVSLQGFYMDETEITNNEYRQFVNWVTDSIAHRTLDHLDEDDPEGEKLDWSIPIDYVDPEGDDYATLEGVLIIPSAEMVPGFSNIDDKALNYEWKFFDWNAFGNDKQNRSKAEFYTGADGSKNINIYPDTRVWIKDFSYSYNEPWTRQYFIHPAFDNYPVVGVTWKQAMAFSDWRTEFWNNYRRGQGLNSVDKFRLPTETEWEYAARGGRQNMPYPWGGPYIRNRKGCILANFKPGRGNYAEDGGLYTVPANAYWPNDWGLYNMAGNVAEWTTSAFSQNAVSFVHDLNSNFQYDAKDDETPTMKRKVVRGGSWKDIGYFIQNGTRHWEYQDSAKSYIGFRCVIPFLGRSINDK